MNEELAFAFVDLAGFTALTEAHGDDVGAAQVRRFCEIARSVLTGGAELVKSLGDAVMLAGPPDDVLVTAVALMRACLAEPDFPVPRAGAHAGPAVRQDGDYLGTAVNTAARIAARAAGGQLQLSSSMLPAVMAAAETAVPLGKVPLRNLRDPVDLHMIEMDAGGALIDPVCRMKIALESEAEAPQARRRGLVVLLAALRGGVRAGPRRVHARTLVTLVSRGPASFRQRWLPTQTGDLRPSRSAVLLVAKRVAASRAHRHERASAVGIGSPNR